MIRIDGEHLPLQAPQPSLFTLSTCLQLRAPASFNRPQVYHPSALNGATASSAAAAHLRSKQALMELLQARVLDKAAHARQRALQVRGRSLLA